MSENVERNDETIRTIAMETTPLASEAPTSGYAATAPLPIETQQLPSTAPIPPTAQAAPPVKRGLRLWTLIWGLFIVTVGASMLVEAGRSQSVNANSGVNIGIFFIVFLFLAAAALIVKAITTAVRNRR